MKISRNSPCPCGSGKKYKKCCLDKEHNAHFENNSSPAPMTNISAAKLKDDFITPGEIGDYSKPQLDAKFFEDNPIAENSVQNIFFHVFTNPVLESLAIEFVRRETYRGKEEERKIKKAKTLAELINVMEGDPDPLNHRLLVDRIVEQADEAVPIILSELESRQDSKFVELAVRIIYESEMDCAAELMQLIKEKISRVYNLSLLYMLLGAIGSDDATKPLWDCYHFLKEKFPNDTYCQGPLIGLYELYCEAEENDEDEFDEEEDEKEKFLDLEPQKIIALLPEKFQEGLAEATIEQLKSLIMSNQKIAAVKLFREKTDAGLKEAKEAIETIEESLMYGEEEEEENDLFDDEYDEAEADEQDVRIETIFGTKKLAVTKKSLKTYLAYLKENITLPCELTGIEDFDWEERYVFGYGSKKEYEQLKKTHPSYTDKYKLIGLRDDIDVDNGILVEVERISDKKRFTLPLADLETTDEKSNNYQLLDDYSVWFVNYR